MLLRSGVIRLAAFATIVVGSLASSNEAAAFGETRQCTCSEALAMQYEYELDCAEMSQNPPNYCAYISSCWAHYIGAGWWDIHGGGGCELSGDNGNDPCTYAPTGPEPWCE
jgi:hypothetical protein